MLQFVRVSSLAHHWRPRMRFSTFIRFLGTLVFGEASRVTIHPWRPRMKHREILTPTQLPLPLTQPALLTEPEYRSIVTALAQVLLTAARTGPGGQSDG